VIDKLLKIVYTVFSREFQEIGPHLYQAKTETELGIGGVVSNPESYPRKPKRSQVVAPHGEEALSDMDEWSLGEQS